MSYSNIRHLRVLPPSDPPHHHRFEYIIGQSAPMQEIFRVVDKVAKSDTTIIINGETGTGKGLIARAIHESSSRREKPFIQINCGATPEGLLESEFFGHMRGSFTGATADKPGIIRLFHGTARDTPRALP